MNIVEQEMQKKFDEGVNEGIKKFKKRFKQNAFEQLVDDIQEGQSERSVRRLIISGDFTEDEIQDAYEKAKKQ